jgi:hypothetical protein
MDALETSGVVHCPDMKRATGPLSIMGNLSHWCSHYSYPPPPPYPILSSWHFPASMVGNLLLSENNLDFDLCAVCISALDANDGGS